MRVVCSSGDLHSSARPKQSRQPLFLRYPDSATGNGGSGKSIIPTRDVSEQIAELLLQMQENRLVDNRRNDEIMETLAMLEKNSI